MLYILHKIIQAGFLSYTSTKRMLPHSFLVRGCNFYTTKILIYVWKLSPSLAHFTFIFSQHPVRGDTQRLIHTYIDEKCLTGDVDNDQK